MPSVVVNGLRYIQKKHAIQCKKCLDVIESKSHHDFKYCSCGAVGIDGGIAGGNRILGNLDDIEDKCIYKADDGSILPQNYLINQLKNKSATIIE